MGIEEHAKEFYGLFKQHLNGSKRILTFVVECKRVDWEAKTMRAVDNAGLEFFNVSLGLGAICVKPKKGSRCIIGVLEGQGTATFLLNAEAIELVEYNGGQNGGLTITPELVTQLGKMTSRIDGIIQALNNAMPATGAPDSGAALIASIKTSLQAIQHKEDFSKIEDTKITH